MHPSNWRLESYWGVGAYSEVGADLVLYGSYFIDFSNIFLPVRSEVLLLNILLPRLWDE